MSDGRVLQWLSGDRSRLVWVDFDRYARRVFAGSVENWTHNAAQQAAILAQAHNVVPSEVVALDVWDPFLRASDLDADAVEALEGMNGNLFVAELVDAVAHHCGGRADIVLRLPAPKDIVLGAWRCPNTVNFQVLDDAMLAFTVVLRSLSAKQVAGIVVNGGNREFDDEELEALDSVAAVARHYGWFVAVSGPAIDSLPPWCSLGLDAERRPAARQGGGLGLAFWQNASPPPLSGLLYGVVPDDLLPEDVVRAAARLAI